MQFRRSFSGNFGRPPWFFFAGGVWGLSILDTMKYAPSGFCSRGFVGHKTYTCSPNTLQLTASLPYYRCRQKETVSHNRRYELLVKVIRSIISHNLSAIRSPYCARISGGVRFEVMMVNNWSSYRFVSKYITG